MAAEQKKIIYAVPSYAKEIELTVKQDIAEDTGKAIVRIHESTRRELGVNVGDDVEIIGPRVLKAKVEKLENFLTEEGAIIMDKLLREKLPVAVGIKVAIRKPLKLEVEGSQRSS